ncbi:MAG: NAD(P)-binding domain-containing protein [Rhizobiales bacterium]|nr:NAD(P)-binding domain-containing protein [Hyphomicrobiales bacterium]MBI3671986.1 NAD(P)-binding domain-containing protein [Hyphomicrobiales bacterium]
MDRIGFVGLGRMGRPMASSLCRKGFRLIAYDINPEALAAVEQLQAHAAASVVEVAADAAKLSAEYRLSTDRGETPNPCPALSDPLPSRQFREGAA